MSEKEKENPLYSDMTNSGDRPWFKDVGVVDPEDARKDVFIRLSQLASRALSHRALSTNRTLTSLSVDWEVKKRAASEIREYLKERDAKLIYRLINDSGVTASCVYGWLDGYVFVTCYGGLLPNIMKTGEVELKSESDADEEDGLSINATLYLTNEIDAREFLEIYYRNQLEVVEIAHEHPGEAYVLAVTPGGIRLIPVGLSGKDLIRGNYHDDTLRNYDKAVKDLNTDSPTGRVIILEGPPGTGKTHMVRGFMKACSECRFVFVQPHMLDKLADPGFVTTFIQEMGGPGPIVIVLEDADACLSERKAENMSSISALLNLTDGIIGELFDIRVLATTNTRSTEFDQAIIRPGRLSSHIELGKLSAAKGRSVWERLSGGKPWPFDQNDGGTPHTLAELYLKRSELTEAEKSIAEARALGATAN